MRIEVDIPLSIKEICNAINSAEYASDAYVSAICTDTRKARKHDLFIALPGENDSGEKYVSDAILKGCYVISKNNISGVIATDNTVDALLKIAELYKSKIKPIHTVAVTGSVGKSTTVRFIAEILKTEYKIHAPVGNFNNHIGVPLTILAAPKNTDVLILELGMNHKNEISQLSKTARPSVGVITSVGTAHIGNLHSRENIASAKLEIRDGMNSGYLLLPHGEPLLYGINNALYVGRNDLHADFSLNDESNSLYSFKSGYGNIDNLRFFDTREHLLTDLSFAVSVSKILGISDESIIKACISISNNDLRQRFINTGDFTIFDDSYNASLESVIADLKYIKSLDRPTGAFLGDVLELGESTEAIHERIGREAALIGIDRLYLFGDYAYYTARGAIKGGMKSEQIFLNPDPSSPDISIDHIRKNHIKNEIILFKASHKRRFDKIADILAQDPSDTVDTF